MFINRKYDRTEHDDFVLNVEHHLNERTEIIEVRIEDGTLVGWKIQLRYE